MVGASTKNKKQSAIGRKKKGVQEMAEPLTVNSQITDAVTQDNVKVLGDAPAQAMGNLYQTIGHSTGLAGGNAVTAQQQANVIHQAATTMGVTLLYTLGIAAGGNAADNADGGDAAPPA